MEMQENIELKPYTSLYVGGPARYFSVVTSIDQIKEALSFARDKGLSHFIIGGGSNIVISDLGFEGLVIKIAIPGVTVVNEDSESVCFQVGAGESWDGFVKYVVGIGLYGIENLSHIPGTVGASVVQNIGAYGQEVSNYVTSIKVLDVKTLEEKTLNKEGLDFSYRRSCLNDNAKDKGKYVVSSVNFKLMKNGELNTKYDDIKKYFEKYPEKTMTLQTIREAIVEIRNRKFPFPDSPEHGTAGSFWNADVIDDITYENIIMKLGEMGFTDKAQYMIDKKNAFTVSQGLKVPYGFLVEVLGFKGKIVGGVKILETHSGVINNFSGRGPAKDVMSLSSEVVTKIKDTFGISLRVEPELVGDFDGLSKIF